MNKFGTNCRVFKVFYGVSTPFLRVYLLIANCSGGSRIFRRGGVDLDRRGCGLPRQLCFENFVCQNERIGTLRGGRAARAPPRSANELVFGLTAGEWLNYSFVCSGLFAIVLVVLASFLCV